MHPLDPRRLAKEIEDALTTSGYNADVVEGGSRAEVEVLVRHPTHPGRTAVIVVKRAAEPGA